MTDFVLVPGAWLGAWAWEPVVEGLTAEGHRVFPVTLPGLAERAGERPADQIGVEEHINDVVDLLGHHDLRDVVLAGHSYAGVVAAGATDRAAGRVRRTVYVDAVVPEPGGSLVDRWGPEGEKFMTGLLAETGGLWTPPTAEEFVDEYGLTAEQAQFLLARATPVPGRCAIEPVRMSQPPAAYPSTYIACLRGDGYNAAVQGFAGQPGWDVVTMDTTHWPMITMPDRLTEILLDIATR